MEFIKIAGEGVCKEVQHREWSITTWTQTFPTVNYYQVSSCLATVHMANEAYFLLPPLQQIFVECL